MERVLLNTALYSYIAGVILGIIVTPYKLVTTVAAHETVTTYVNTPDYLASLSKISLLVMVTITGSVVFYLNVRKFLTRLSRESK